MLRCLNIAERVPGESSVSLSQAKCDYADDLSTFSALSWLAGQLQLL